ncbi:hypothetical protein N7478_001481 [Penicillium angulare]|uniref:uncharacterized protein n=1 Tax=Penicillium angulare TaxID=116970 RepID=UPI0025414455|nr:uncharacterized protein N7478_001481 [Penicillium angulare]KAJ5292230.1 hypothetical protein N7478_001481 [Penicillium angulare]
MSSQYPILSSGVGASRMVSHGPIISFECGPPSQVCQGAPFPIIVNVAFLGSEEMQKGATFAFNISLGDNRGHLSGKGLSGSLTSSLETIMDGGCQRVAAFKDIAIHEVGRHRLRILLAAAFMFQVTVIARLDSDFVEVQAA